MKQLEHLQYCELVLRTRSPLFIGSGDKYAKYSYLFDDKSRQVSIIDEDRLFECLVSAGRRMVDSYEAFVLGRHGGMESFFRNNRFSPADISRVTRYKVSAADALIPGESLKDIFAFMRNANGAAYIPGSSLKGALRTALLVERVRAAKKGNWPFHVDAKNQGNRIRLLEGEYLNELNLKLKNGVRANAPINDIMRGVMVSDSETISDDKMILCAKIDVTPQGVTNSINTCRECVRPGTDIRFRLTLDQSVLKGGITMESLRKTIQAYSDAYQQLYLKHFAKADALCDVSYDGALVLGGGAGYFSKTLTYPYLGYEAGFDDALYVMQKFQAKEIAQKHLGAEWMGIAPHMLKCTKYNGKLYPYGVCEVVLE